MNRFNPRASLLWLLCAAAGCAAPVTEEQPMGNTATRVTPFLLFQDGRAEEAMNFYASLFPDGEVVSVERYPADGEGPEGTLYQGSFRISGQTVRCFDSPIKHAFEFTPSISFFVDCSSADEIERLVAALGEPGQTMMPLGDYGFSKQFAWVEDRYGISWQLNLPFDDE